MGKKRSFREHGVNELPGMTQAGNEAWIENIRCTSSDRDASGMASLKCQPSSINQSARNITAAAMVRLLWGLLMVSATALKGGSDTGGKSEVRGMQTHFTCR